MSMRQRRPAAAGAGPASTSCFVTGSMRKLSPSNVREPSKTVSFGGFLSSNVDEDAARPTLQHCSIHLAEAPLVVALDAE